MSIPELYTEKIEDSEQYRALYVESVGHAVERMMAKTQEKRAAWISPEKMRDNPDFYYEEYKKMIGIQNLIDAMGNGAPRIEETPHAEDALCTISRMKIYLAEDVVFTGIFFKPKKAQEPLRLIVCSHGGGGSPELCSDMIGPNNYSHMVRRCLEGGAAVFAPQLMLWSLAPARCGGRIPQYGTPYDRSKSNRDFRLCGTGMASFEIYAITRTATALMLRPDIKSDAYRMTGLSYGGFYTLYTMAYDRRIECGYSVAYFNDKFIYDWHDMIFDGSGARFTDVEVAALCAPRRLFIEIGRTDPVFDGNEGEKLFPLADAYFAAQNASENVRFNCHPGGHAHDPEGSGMRFLLENL